MYIANHMVFDLSAMSSLLSGFTFTGRVSINVAWIYVKSKALQFKAMPRSSDAPVQRNKGRGLPAQ